MRIFHLDGQRARFFGWVVIPAGKNGVPNKNHLRNGNAQDVPQFSNTVSFVDPMLGNVNRRRTAQTHESLRNQFVETRLHLLALAEIRIPVLLFIQGSLLPESGKCDLAASILDD